VSKGSKVRRVLWDLLVPVGLLVLLVRQERQVQQGRMARTGQTARTEREDRLEHPAYQGPRGLPDPPAHLAARVHRDQQVLPAHLAHRVTRG